VRNCELNPPLAPDGSGGFVNVDDMHACLPPNHTAQVGDKILILSGTHSGKKGFIKHILPNTGCLETTHLLNQAIMPYISNPFFNLFGTGLVFSYDPATCPACCDIQGWQPSNPPTISSLHFQTPQGLCTTECSSPVADPDGGLLAFPETQFDLPTTTPPVTGGLVDPVITAFLLDFNDIQEAGETREFSIRGDNGAEFYLEVKNEDSSYYN
jgi:hypothetical protein